MASIQVLEILPVEAQLEDLSDDMTSRIQGGQECSTFQECFLDRWLRIQERFLDLTERWLEFFGTDPINP